MREFVRALWAIADSDPTQDEVLALLATWAPASPVPESAFNEGRLFQFLRMKKERPIDPLYWDMHEENNLRELVPAPPTEKGKK